MKHAVYLSILAGALAAPVTAQQPLDAECSTSATQATGYTPGADSGPQAGGRVAGAAKGAAAGAAVGAVQGNQYDNASGRAKDANQQNKAQNGAAAGMAVAGSRNRQDRREGRQDQDAWQKSYDGCVAARARQLRNRGSRRPTRKTQGGNMRDFFRVTIWPVPAACLLMSSTAFAQQAGQDLVLETRRTVFTCAFTRAARAVAGPLSGRTTRRRRIRLAAARPSWSAPSFSGSSPKSARKCGRARSLSPTSTRC